MYNKVDNINVTGSFQMRKLRLNLYVKVWMTLLNTEKLI